MYMANARILRWGPNATYITPVRIWGWRWGNPNFSVFRCWREFRVRGLDQREHESFASQWNIGFSLQHQSSAHVESILCFKSLLHWTVFLQKKSYFSC